MFVSKLNIIEFRGIKRCEKPINLSKFTVLIGRNNVGKSTILEALYLFPDPTSNDGILDGSRLTIIKGILHSGEHLAYGYSGTVKLEYTVDNTFFCITIDDSLRIKRYANDKDVTNLSLSDLKDLLKIRAKDEYSATILIPNRPSLIKDFDKVIRDRPIKNRIMKQGSHVKIAKVISKCVDDKFTDIYLDDMKIRKELPDGNFFYIHIDDLGDGIKKAVRVMLLVEALKPDVILWDDFEVFAHPSLIESLLKWLAEGDWQVVLTTHSIDVLYELLNVKETVKSDEIAVLQLAKTKDDILTFERLTIDDLEDLLLANQDPRRLTDLLTLR